ncbi:hypothetical protein FRB94_009391 [Tulasnella sp. JGI-2019a]|nr:hypothetical protein FRB94_009391 [Tulasnella sp. JGI-2019a]
MSLLQRGSMLRNLKPIVSRSAGSSTASRVFSTSLCSEADIDGVAQQPQHVRQPDQSRAPVTKRRTWNGSGLDPSDTGRSRFFLRVTGLPKTAIHSDVWRMLKASQVEGCQNVYLDYFRLVPLGAAWLSFATEKEQNAARTVLRRLAMSTFPLTVETIEGTPFKTMRRRGAEGREAALERGIPLIGNGPDAGIRERGTGVVLFGLPGKLFTDSLHRACIQGFELKGQIKDSIIKLESARTLTSRFYIRLDSEAEAHRLVRSLHMNTFQPTEYGDRYVIRARVVY